MALRTADPQPRATRAAGGFTLLEVMIVMSILAILMGIGVGQMQRLNFSRFAAVGQVKTVLRNAREAAVATGLPVAVVCDKEDQRIYDLAVRQIGQWGFETSENGGASGASSPGAFGLQARLVGATIQPIGRIGGGLVCVTPGARAEVSVDALPAWNFGDGFSAETDLFVSSLATASILSRGKQFKITVGGDGAVEVQVAVAESDRQRMKGAGALVVTSPPNMIIPERWSHVAVVYDRCALTLMIDGVARGSKEASEPVLYDPAPFVMGDKNGVCGVLDGVKVGAIVSREGQKLPKESNFGFTAPRALIRFDGDGRLDAAYHAGPVTVPLVFNPGGKRDIQIGPYGTVR